MLAQLNRAWSRGVGEWLGGLRCGGDLVIQPVGVGLRKGREQGAKGRMHRRKIGIEEGG